MVFSWDQREKGGLGRSLKGREPGSGDESRGAGYILDSENFPYPLQSKTGHLFLMILFPSLENKDKIPVGLGICVMFGTVLALACRRPVVLF